MNRVRLALVLAVMVPASASQAGSVSIEPQSFTATAGLSVRVLRAKVIGPYDVKVEGDLARGVEVAVETVVKGRPAAPGERLRVFNPSELHDRSLKRLGTGWLEASSYSIDRYEHAIDPWNKRALKPGLSVLVFLGDGKPTPGFPPDAVFLTCEGAFEKARRDAEVAGIKSAPYGQPVVLSKGQIAVAPYGLELELKELVAAPRAAARIVLRRRGATRSVLLEPGQSAPPQVGVGGWQLAEVQVVSVDGAGATVRAVDYNPVRPKRARPADAGPAPAP